MKYHPTRHWHWVMRRSLALGVLGLFALTVQLAMPSEAWASEGRTDSRITYRTTEIDGLQVFYREAGPTNAPVLLLLHGFPTSSQMFRNLMPKLADRYRVIAPDYPGFGQSSAPSPDAYAYTFDGIADIIEKLTVKLGADRYFLYVMDYGAPIGFRIAARNPGKVNGLIVQNGNAYMEGIGAFWDAPKAFWKEPSKANQDAMRRAVLTFDATKWQYLNGVSEPSLVSPDAYVLDQAYLDRQDNWRIQLALFYDYQNNLPKYPEWQAYFRKFTPPTLVLWGANDEIFLVAGAEPYRRDNPRAQVHIFPTGHFALETHGEEMAALIGDFLAANARDSARQ